MKELFVYAFRGNTVETRHRVHAVVLHGNNVLFECGDANIVTPMRSAAKPFMVCRQIELSKESGIKLLDEQISLMASSHNGEISHRNVVEAILTLSNSNLFDLHCGTHIPFFDWLYAEYFNEKNLLRRQLYHNCSGKHAGMLLLAELVGCDKAGYWDSNHPVQQMIIKSFKDLIKLSDHDLFSLALDGCGVPTYCITLKKMAEAYQTLYKDDRLQSVVTAVMNSPYMIAGKDRIETDIIRECHYFAKSGSDGIFCVSMDKDISIALKVEDGSDDAAESAIVEILSTLNLLSDDQQQMLNKYRYLEMFTSTGFKSGSLSPVWIS